MIYVRVLRYARISSVCKRYELSNVYVSQWCHEIKSLVITCSYWQLLHEIADPNPTFHTLSL